MNTSNNYKFTKDWFAQAEQVWPQLIPLLPARKRFLEIGSFEGRSAVWVVENMMEVGGEIHCIDTWKGGEEHGGEDMEVVEDRFLYNMELATSGTGKDYNQIPATSVAGMNLLYADNETYDFIYIDGSHVARDVLTDACMAWQLLKPKGVMVFDDYLWGDPRDILHRPRLAIDAFCNIFAEEVEIVHVGYQLAVRKKEQ